MSVYKKSFVVLAFLAALLLYGCDGESISLEEALVAESGVSETGLEGALEEGAGTDAVEEHGTVYVYVCGAVRKPGVYALTSGSRVIAAIEAAGGFLPDAAREAVNLAKVVTDESQITVPDITQQELMVREESRERLGYINLNTATVEELCTLSGIGETRAQAILAYRREIGGFRDITQLLEVSGIGESLFDNIKGNIYIE